MLDLESAAGAIRRGGVVAFPTETVYGLAASAKNADAQRRIYEIKERPASLPLILMVARTAELEDWVEMDERAQGLMLRHWPGALTLVLPRRGQGGTLGVRIPDHALALGLLRLTGPLLTTSANRSGQPPALTAEEAGRLPGLAGVLDGGRVREGSASTLLDLSRPTARILREGPLSAADLGL